jgi:hypothetical protein
VKPYIRLFSLYPKGNWCGKTLFDIFATHFRALSPEYAVRA